MYLNVSVLALYSVLYCTLCLCTEFCANRAGNTQQEISWTRSFLLFRVYGGFSLLFLLLMSQQFTNLAAVFALC